MNTFRQQSELYLAKITACKRAPVKPTSLATIKSLVRAAMPVLGKIEPADIKSGAMKTLAEHLGEQDYSTNSIESIIATAKSVVLSDQDEDGDPRHLRKWNDDYIFENVAAPSKRIAAVVTEEQLEDARKIAKKNGKSVSTWARDALLAAIEKG